MKPGLSLFPSKIRLRIRAKCFWKKEVLEEGRGAGDEGLRNLLSFQGIVVQRFISHESRCSQL
jgi:hypothetical protein